MCIQILTGLTIQYISKACQQIVVMFFTLFPFVNNRIISPTPTLVEVGEIWYIIGLPEQLKPLTIHVEDK